MLNYTPPPPNNENRTIYEICLKTWYIQTDNKKMATQHGACALRAV